MNEKVKGIFIDSEGTLRDKNKNISNDIREVISNLKKRKIEIVITTGLPRFIAQKISLDANLSRYVIASNGADIYDYEGKVNLCQKCINFESFEKIYNACRDEFNIIVGIGNTEYSNIINEYNFTTKILKKSSQLFEKPIFQIHISQKKISDFKNVYIEIRDFLKYNDINMLRNYLNLHTIDCLCKNFLLLTNTELNNIIRVIEFIKLKRLQANLLEILNNEIRIGNQSIDFTNFCFNGETPWFSINSPLASKGNAIINMCKVLNISKESVIGIGNDYNDMSMKESVGTFLHPTDARDELMADDETLSYDNKSLTKILRRIEKHGKL